jgi:hypothetical protein
MFCFLFRPLSQAFTDEIHTVVKQSLNAFEQILPLLLLNEPLSCLVANEDTKTTFAVDMFDDQHRRNNLFLDGDATGSNSSNGSIAVDGLKFLHNFFHVSKNKYWLVQCKYADIIASMNFNELTAIFGEQFGKVAKVIFYVFACTAIRPES